MQRITKAVELDDLQPVDDMVKHSSSAVDIRTVLLQAGLPHLNYDSMPNHCLKRHKAKVALFQIKTFWRQLAWPDAEGAYAYLSKILDVSSYNSEMLMYLT